METTTGSYNYKVYRETEAAASPPLICYIGVYLRDLTFIEDGNDTYLNEETKLINYEKMKMLATTFAKIHQYQQVAYKFDAHPGVVEYLTKARVIIQNDEELRKCSLSCEPSKRHSYHFETKTFECLASKRAAGMVQPNLQPVQSPRYGSNDESADEIDKNKALLSSFSM